MNTFKFKIKELRIEKGLSQKQLANEMGLSEKTISHYERGYSEPSLDILIKLCIFFSISADFLLGIKEILDIN